MSYVKYASATPYKLEVSSTDKSKWRVISVNRRLLDMLDELVEHEEQDGLPHPTGPDRINMLLLHYLIQETRNEELIRLARRLEKTDRNIHTAIEEYFSARCER